MAAKKVLICYKCKKELQPTKTYLSYLGHSFFTDMLKCPELVQGRIADVEMQLEDK
jgi:hypothetical protein